MARVYKFQNENKSIDVDILVDAIDDVKHFLIVDVLNLQKSEVILGFDLSRDGYYYEKEFIEYATEKEYNLYRWDNQSYVGQLNEVSAIQLTIAVDGTGTTSPMPGNYDIESGESQLITAIETDVNYIFDHWDQDGNITTTNPQSFTVISNSLIVAYFVAKWLHWVFTGEAGEIITDGLNWAYQNKRISQPNLNVGNTQVATFSGSSYITIDLTGITINSYEGTSTPTKTNDSRIDVTAGEIYSITLSDGKSWYAVSGQGIELKFADTNGNILIGTLIGAILSVFHGSTSDAAYPILNEKGGTIKKVCTTSGTAALLASPNGSNLGSEELSTWVPAIGWTEDIDGSLTCDGSESNLFNTGIVGNSTYKLVEFEITEYISGGVNARFGGGGENKGIIGLGKFREFMRSGTSSFYLDPASFNGTISNISVKEVEETQFDDFEMEFYMKKIGTGGNVSIALSDKPNGSIVLTDFVGYSILNLSGQQLGLYKSDGAGGLATLIQTPASFLDINTNHKFKVNRVNGLFTLYVKYGSYGDEYVFVDDSFDDTYNIFKFILSIGDSLIDFSHLTKDGIKYNLTKLIDGTGVYETNYVIGLDDGVTDADGNDLEYPPNTVWPTIALYRQKAGNTAIFDVTKLYPELDIFYGATENDPLWVTFDQLNDMDLTGIPEMVYKITRDNLVINDMKFLEQ